MKRFLCALAIALPALAIADTFPTPFNSDHAKDAPMAAEETARHMGLPDGFSASVFAAEPDVRQPIAMCFDARGRLWVAECYTYAEHPKDYDLNLRDRIVVFEDSTGSGHFDKRTVFWDGAQRLTSIAVGLGGVYALCLPNLVYIPLRQGEAVMDGPPQVLLDGFDFKASGHNMANGLKWGPDGWLYGRQGILARKLSRLGPPGTPDADRTAIGCGIWRYHPVKHVVEALTEGTTNPWGMDWNEYGEPFFINTVIGHLWEMIPGAHYQRMFGDDPEPHLYGLIPQFADHVHWDTTEKWDDVRKLGVSDASSRAGGGHAHTGLMCYLGDNWPAAYRGKLFTINFHGRRLNAERLDREGSGYVGRRDDDLCFVPDPWFRGIELLQGPDGGVFIADWSETGECHGNDGVTRTTGRIYKVTYGKPKQPSTVDVEDLDGPALAGLLGSSNEWFARMAQQVLQARAVAHQDISGAHSAIEPLLSPDHPTTVRLHALWALYDSGGLDANPPDSVNAGDANRRHDSRCARLRELLYDHDEHLRVWAVRLLGDEVFPGPNLPPHNPADKVVEDFTALAKNDPSPAVRLALASVLQRMPLNHPTVTYAPLNQGWLQDRANIAAALVAHGEDSSDRSLPLMDWYAIAGVPTPYLIYPARNAQIPLIRRYVARRLAEDYAEAPRGVANLLDVIDDPNGVIDVLDGLTEGFKGKRSLTPPIGWSEFISRASAIPAAAGRLRELRLLFGDASALAQTQADALNEGLDVSTRRSALQVLVDNRAADLRAICEKCLTKQELAATACAGLALSDDPATADLLLSTYNKLSAPGRPAAIAALVSRPAFAAKLLDAVAAQQIPAHDITSFHARQIRAFQNPALSAQLASVWGEVRESAGDKKALIDDWTRRLTPDNLAHADLAKGKLVFQQTCALCHKLHGEGASIGPDLTGSGRTNLSYLLDNIGDPSAVVPAEYRLVILSLKDGRVLSGIIASKTADTVTLQTIGERVVINTSDIKEKTESAQSLMPDGLLLALSPEQVRDLVGYLMKP